jgi:hypothetical protein
MAHRQAECGDEAKVLNRLTGTETGIDGLWQILEFSETELRIGFVKMD